MKKIMDFFEKDEEKEQDVAGNYYCSSRGIRNKCICNISYTKATNSFFSSRVA